MVLGLGGSCPLLKMSGRGTAGGGHGGEGGAPMALHLRYFKGCLGFQLQGGKQAYKIS